MPWRQAPERIWWRPPDCPFFDPTLLSCAKKRGVEPPRRNCFRCACRATEQKGCDPFDIPGVLISNCYPVERFYGFRQHSRSGLQLQTSLQLVQRSTCRAANMAVPTAARHFCSAKILAPSRVSQVCRTPDQQPLKSTKQLPAGKMSVPGSPGVPEGPRSLCFGKSPEEPLPRGSVGQFLRGGSTPRFFAQLRRVGSQKDQLAATAGNHTGACRHGRQKLILPPA